MTANPAHLYLDSTRDVVMYGSALGFERWLGLCAWSFATLAVGYILFWLIEVKVKKSTRSRMQSPPTYVVDSPSVVVKNTTKSYVVTDSKSEHLDSRRKVKDGERVVHALKDVSFVASSGESIGLIGRNGSGKSTLLKLIAGAEPLTSGNIFVKARPKLLGVAPALQPYLSGRRNVLLGLLAMGMSRAEAEELAPSIVEWSEIGEAIDRPMSTYSAGQSARLVSLFRPPCARRSSWWMRLYQPAMPRSRRRLSGA